MAATGAEPTLVTERLVLRRPLPADAPVIAAHVSDPEILRFLPLLPDPYRLVDAEHWIAEAARNFAEKGICDLVMCRAGDGVLVGAVGFRPRPDGTAETGYWVARQHRGHGYAAEATRRLVAHAFERLGYRRIVAAARPENVASQRVLLSAGFTRIGEETREYPNRGWRHVLDLYAVDAPECGFDPAPLPPLPMKLVAAVALVDLDGRVLIARRPPGKPMAGLWEFPGGKVHEGETPEAALVRELREELGIDTARSCLAPFTFASHRYERFHLLMPLYLCRRWLGTPTPREGQELAWVKANRLADYPMPPADVPLIAMLRDFL
jgi:8-oxo-dGTP diphosphatase